MHGPAPSPMRRVRVLLLLDQLHDYSAGAERMAAGLALHLPKDRFDVTLCTTRTGHGKMLESLKESGVRHLNLGPRRRRDLHRMLPLARTLRSGQIDVVHAHMFGSNVWGTLLGRAARVPVVIAHDHMWTYEGQPMRKLVDGYFIGRLADAFLTVSSEGRAKMIAVEHVPAQKIHVIPNAWIPRDTAQEGDLRAELGLPPGTPLIGTVAVMRRQKALDVMVDAFALARRQVHDLHLVIAGQDDDVKAGLERQAERLGVTEALHFLGYRNDVSVVLDSLDVAVISSDWEGLPLSALEAMAHGCALAVTSVGGLLDVLEDETTALMVPPRDPAALAGAITRLLGDPALRERLGEAARRRSEDFTPERLADRMADLYVELLDRKSGARR